MAELDLRVNLRAFDGMSRVFEQINGRNRRLMQQFNQGRETLRRLNDQLGNIRAYQRHRDALNQNGQALTQMREQMRHLHNQLRNGQAMGRSTTEMRRLREQYERARTSVSQLEQTRSREQQRLAQLSARLRQAGINTRNLSDAERRLRQEAERANGALNQQSERLRRIAEQQQRAAERMRIRDQRLAAAGNASMAGYVGLNAARHVGHALASPVSEYMAQEQASADLKVTMMRADGSFGAFEEINKQAKALGNVLPGTTQDFIHLAAALKKQGVKDDVLSGGGLARAAELSVLMNMGQEEGGTFAARMIEAHGLNPDDLQKAADMTQRAYYAFGLRKEDMAESMKYYAPTVNALGLTGNGNYETLLAIQGMAARQGLEGSMFGTNFSAMVSRLSKGPKMIEEASRGMKAEARDILEQSGVQFAFFDEAGKFKGLEAMVAEMEKLHIITQKFGEESAMLVAKELFGEEAARPALLLAQQGSAGLQQAMTDMREQADMQARIAAKTSTLAAAFEQLGGVWGGFKGLVGESLREPLLSLAKTLQGFMENTLQPFIENNKGLVKWIMIAGVALAGLAAVGGMLLLVFAGLTSAWALLTFGIGSAVGGFMRLRGALTRFAAMLKPAWTWLVRFAGVLKTATLGLWRFAVAAGKTAWLALQKFIAALARFAVAAGQTALAALRSLIAGLASFAVTLGKGIVAGVMALGNAVLWLARSFLLLARAMLTNPVVLAITAIIAVGWLLYQNWTQITAYLRERWEALKNWWLENPVSRAIIDAFSRAIEWLANLPQTLWHLMTTAGGKVVEAIAAWDVAATLIGLFTAPIDTVMGKLDGLIGKIKQAWTDFQVFVGWKEGSILAREDLNAAYSAAPRKSFAQKQAEHVQQQAKAAREAEIRRANPALDHVLKRVEEARKPGILPTPPLRRPQAANTTQTVNIHINAEGMGSKEAVALIKSEVGKGISQANRELAARSRAALYDAHA